MNIKKIIKFLETEDGREFFLQLHKEEFSINKIIALEQKNPDKPIKDLLSLINIQKKSKLENSTEFVLTEKGAQQASSTLVAKYHAKRFSGFQTYADLCCGNGIDLHYISENKQKAFAVDLDEDTLLAAKYNNRNNLNITFLQMKAEEFPIEVEAIFIDPDRREGNRRLIDPEDLSPRLSDVLKLEKITPNIMMKLSPAMDYDSLNLSYKHSFEFVSENGELKEILLCLGDFANLGKRAVLLPQEICLDENNQELTVSGIQKYILEPDPAVIRAGLVQDLGYNLGCDLLDSYLALLSSDHEIQSEFTKTYEVVDHFDYNLKKLKKYLRQAEIGRLVIKTRGFSQSVEQFRKKLNLKGNNETIMFIIRIGDGHKIIFANFLRKPLRNKQ